MSKLWRKLTIWGAVIVSLITTCFLPYLTFAAGVTTDVITLPSTAGQLKEAAEIQLVVNTFKKCVEAAPAGGTYEYEGKDVYGTAKEKKDIFPNIFVNNTHTDIAAGAWLEYKVQNKVNNGTIYCDDSDSKILNLFADKLGISTTAVVCNINAGNDFEVGQRGGLLKRVVLRYKPGNNMPYYDVSNSCASGLSNSTSYYVWAKNGWNYDTDSSGTAEYLGGVDYVRFLYDRFKNSSDNPYLVEWDELGNFTNPAMGYYLYLNDFYTSCGSSTVDPSTTNASNMWSTPISLIDENYGVSEAYFSKNVVKEDWDSSFVNRSTPHTCTAVINRINELVDGARGELISRKQEACNSASFDIADRNWHEAQDILNNPEMDEESKAKAQEVLDQINAYDGEFWTYTESGGVVCQPIPSVTGATTIVDEDPIVTPEPGPGEDPGVLDGCSANAGAIGWIVCPVLRILGEATDAMFITVADQYLSVDPDVINNPGMNEAWRTFQTFANIVFVIFLLVVILSQVTGFGISNYGVKKILPRLIITAVLVNLSFVLCAVAADLSNITGSGLDSLFRSIHISNKYTADFNFGSFIWNTISNIGTAAPLAIAGTALGITIADGGWSVLIMPILLATIVGFISILFFYILLAVRRAAIYILIAISPIAIVCYMLPNTQKLFSRWLKMFTSMLLVFPICGALMGGGNFASRLLLITASDSVGFVYILVCSLLSVVPFFFIPTILKNSMSALGSIGAKIANMGSRWSNMATGALRRSRWAQDHQQRIARNIDMGRNNRLQNRWKSRYKDLKKMREEQGDQFSSRNQRRLKRAEYEFARVKSRAERAAREEDQASVIADQEEFSEGSLRRTAFRDALEDKAQEERIGNLRSAAYHGHLDYTDEHGNKHVVDVKNIGGITADGELMEYEMDEDGVNFKLDSNGRKIAIKGARNSLSAAFLNYNRAYDRAMADYNTATTAKDKDAAMARAQDAKIKAQAIATELLDAGGDNGQTAVGRALKSIKFDDAGNPLDRSLTQSVDEVSKFITRNGKWMAQIKRTDNGMFRLLNDAANEAATFKTRMNYATGGDLKITAEAVPDLSDGYLGGVTYEIIQGSYDNDPKAAGRLLELDAAIQRAMSDPRIANRIKPETMNFLQKIHQKAYEIQRGQWLEATDDTGNLVNISQLSGYADDGTGNIVEVQANGVNNSGQLTYNGQVMLDAIGGAALHKNDAYAKQIRQATELVRGKVQDGEVKILRKRDLPSDWEYDSQKKEWGRRVPATINPNTHIMTPAHWEALSPEEAAKARQITEYNASVDIQNQGN